MADPRLENVFRALDGSFLGAQAHADEEAANDLALSLVQGRGLSEALARMGPLCILGSSGERLPVSLVAADFVAAGARGERLSRLASSVFLQDPDGSAPRHVEETLARAVRAMARGKREVSAEVGDRVFEGRVLVGGPDYLVLETTGGRVTLSFDLISCLRLPDGGVAGAL